MKPNACPLLAHSGHRLLQRTCPLVTQSRHWGRHSRASNRRSSWRNPHEESGAAKEQGEKDDEVSDTLDHLLALRSKDSERAKLLAITRP